MPTLADLRTATLDEADLVSGQVDTDVVDRIVNECLGELYEFLCQSFEGVFSAEADFTLASVDAGAMALPSDFFQASDVEDITDGASPVSLPAFEWMDRNNVGQKSWTVHGGQILIRPTDSAPGAYRFTYVPSFQDLEEDDDITIPNGWVAYAVLTAAIRLKESQELSTSDLENRRQAFETRIRNAARKRKGPRRVRDVTTDRTFSQAWLDDWRVK